MAGTGVGKYSTTASNRRILVTQASDFQNI